MKKCKYCMIAFGFVFLQSHSQNMLKSNWKFSTGDDPSWARMEHDDSQWRDI